jgi:regulator of protease activity HflC (stomatin/prohibitin superfamily)
MAEEAINEVSMDGDIADYGQLVQVSVPLEDAALAFSSRDESGRIPIIIIPARLNRIRNDVLMIGVIGGAAGIAAGLFLSNGIVITLSILIGLILVLVGFYRSLYVRIPEGANGLLTRGGRYLRTIGSGTYVLPPWIYVSHLVSRREIPFNVPVVEAPTNDNVRVGVDILTTFQITDPYHFVYNISAADFDEVFQAAAQDGLRSMIRGMSSTDVIDLQREQMDSLQDSLSNDVQAYGVRVTKINVTYAMPPDDFMHSLEGRQLAITRRAEQLEKQVLALQQQKDGIALAQEEVIAEVERERERLQVLIQKAETNRTVLELEAEAEALRLSKMEARLQENPTAAQFELEMARLAVAQALAGNTRAVLQIGSADDIVRSFVLRDLIEQMPDTDAAGQVTSTSAATEEEGVTP